MTIAQVLPREKQIIEAKYNTSLLYTTHKQFIQFNQSSLFQAARPIEQKEIHTDKEGTTYSECQFVIND